MLDNYRRLFFIGLLRNKRTYLNVHAVWKSKVSRINHAYSFSLRRFVLQTAIRTKFAVCAVEVVETQAREVAVLEVVSARSAIHARLIVAENSYD